MQIPLAIVPRHRVGYRVMSEQAPRWVGPVAVRKLRVGGWLVHVPNAHAPDDGMTAFWIRELDDEDDARRLATFLNDWREYPEVVA